MNWNHVRTLRWLIAGFGLVAGLVLLAVGQGLIGGILVVMGGLRIVMLLSMNRRMGSYRSGAATAPGSAGRFPAAGGRVGGRRDEMLQRLARNELDVAAAAIGITPDELRRAVDDGRTISVVAGDAGVPTDRVVDAVVRDDDHAGRPWCRRRQCRRRPSTHPAESPPTLGRAVRRQHTHHARPFATARLTAPPDSEPSMTAQR